MASLIETRPLSVFTIWAKRTGSLLNESMILATKYFAESPLRVPCCALLLNAPGMSQQIKTHLSILIHLSDFLEQSKDLDIIVN